MQEHSRIMKCDCCEKPFKIFPSRIKNINFCSIECSKVYRSARGTGAYPISFVEDENGCFICTSHKPGKRGYPRLRREPVFRHIYKQMHGEIPIGSVIRHLCDNKLCINPEHLRPGTQKENIQDAIRNGKMPRGSRKPNAIYDELQIYGLKVLLDQTDLTNAELEHITTISRSTIEAIRADKQWKHVTI